MRLITFLLSGLIAFRVFGAVEETLLTRKHTNANVLVQGPNDANIARLVARILEGQHYLKQSLNDEASARFLDRYLDALDNLHLYFLQSDLAEFEKYKTTLDDLTLKEGDTTPSRVIFTRFLERLQQQYDYVIELLKTEKFEFTGTDRFVLNRKTLPRPKDLAEAKQLWRDRLRYEYLQEKLNKEKPEEIVKIITRRYTRVLRALKEYDNDDVLQVYLTSLARIYDPHSDYMGKSELENFSINMKLSLFGIGALLRSEDGICRIQSLVPGGPAERSKKLKPNDKIIAVAQGEQEPVDVVDMKLNKVVEQIRGPKDTEVRLTVISADASDSSVRQVISLVREEIKLEDQEAKAKIFELPTATNKPMRVGVIDLPSFYSGFELEGRKSNGDQKSTTTDVAKLIGKLVQENVGGIILDLRRNGGGSLEEAINLTGLFIKEGPVVQVQDSKGKVFVDNDPDSSVAYDGPLIVLTSRFSASASEILAGALQDYGRAVIVGDKSTHGKGTVQSLLQLAPILRGQLISSNNPGAVKITIRKFYRASGASTQLEGVVPDIVLPSVNNELEVGEASLENPLPGDPIESAAFERLNRVSPYLAELKKRSDQRIASDRDFAFIREEIALYKKNVAEKSVSLNEAQRVKEKEEADVRSKARKKELAARPEPPGKVYEITLKQVNEPGLPPPVAKTNNVTSATQTHDGKTARAGTLVKTDRPKPDSEKKDRDDDEDAVADENVPHIDITLDEARRILVDYLNLISKRSSLAGTAQTDN